jgi:glycosyltransferase involved in cell wall biosynthesis
VLPPRAVPDFGIYWSAQLDTQFRRGVKSMMEQNQQPMFSVIIACYNYGRFLRRAIDSVLAQDYGSYEIIVVDDGSTDETPQVAESYGQKVAYYRQNNAGQSAAYNNGADIAKGAYVYILDADDALVSDSLSTLAQAIARFPDHEAICGGYISVSETLQQSVKIGSAISQDAAVRLKAFLSRQLVGLQNGSVIVKKSVFSRLRFPEHLRNNTDIVFYGHVLAVCTVMGINAPLFFSHEHKARVRKNVDLIARTGMAPVDALFDPRLIPESLMKLRVVYARQRALSIARMLYINRRYEEALTYYRIALNETPQLLARWQVLKRVVFSLIKVYLPGVR